MTAPRLHVRRRTAHQTGQIGCKPLVRLASSCILTGENRRDATRRDHETMIQIGRIPNMPARTIVKAASLNRRTLLRAGGGLAAILASGQAPAFAQTQPKKLVFAHI